MTVALVVNHQKVSLVADDADTSLVRPSDWNATHTITGVAQINTELSGKADNTIVLTAGAGLTGGGDLTAARTFAVGAGVGMTVNADDVALNVNGLTEDLTPDAALDFLATYDASATTHKKVKITNLPIPSAVVQTSRTVTAGAGLTGGGDLTVNRTIDVGAGTGITVATDSVALDTAHARNVDHAGVTITAGAGLTGGGDISVTRTLDVGAGAGITVATDSVGLDTASTRNTDHAGVAINTSGGLTGGGDITATRTLTINTAFGFTWTVPNIFQAGLIATEQASPANPAANNLHIFAKDVSAITHLFTRDSAGTEVDLSLVANSTPAVRQVIAGAGLTGGGDLTTDRTFNVIGGTSIIVGADDVQRAALTGDVTAGQNVNATVIANDAVTLAKMANMNTDRLIGRDTAAIGDPEEISVAGGLEWTGAGGIQRSALTGDVTAPLGSNATTIANNAVTYAKMQDVTAASRILGRKTALAGDPEECTLSEILDFVGSAAQGDIFYRGAAGWARLAASTAGNLLQTNGAGQNPSWIVPTAGVPTARAITAGAGLTGGGDLSADRTIDVVASAGGGITVNANDIALDTAHNRNVDHSTIDMIAGAGLTGGGTTVASRTFNVGGSTSVIVGADDVQRAALTGDVTAAQNANGTSIVINVVDNTKLADVPTATFKGRTTASTGDPEDLTVAQAKTLLDLTGTNSGDQTITLTGNVTGSGSGSFATTIANDAVTSATIANNAVTNAKLATMAEATIKGRATLAGAGDPQDLTPQQAMNMLGGVAGGFSTLTLTSGAVPTSTTTGALVVTGGIGTGGGLMSGAAIGFPASGGIGGAVTQTGSITTAVTLDKLTGRITTVSSTLGGGAEATFTVNNFFVLPADCPIVWIQSYTGQANSTPFAWVSRVTSGVFDITITNMGTAALNSSISIGVLLLRGATT